MKRVSLILFLICSFLLVACGQSGKLYLPDEKKAAATEKQEETGW